jgi:hypothetical protein
MTEEEWLKSSNPSLVLDFLNGDLSERKWRLWACACCRRIWHLLTDERSRKAVEVAELFADNLASLEELVETCDVAASALGAAIYSADAAASLSGEDILITAMLAADAAAYSTENQTETDRHAEEAIQTHLMRDISGNPFRPVTLLPEWRTSTVVSLAQGIYSDRAFDRMPILADALQDSGCSNEDILTHCRGAGPHTRGCWCLDLVLGKT